MVIIESIDKKLWNIEHKIVDIIKQSTTDDQIIINFIGEGPCLRSCNFYSILDNICDCFSIEKQRFLIRTANNEEFHDEYTIEIIENIWLKEAKKKNVATTTKNTNLLTVGCFTGQANWTRLAFVYWLDYYYKEQSLITCHYDTNIKKHHTRLELNEVMINFPEEISIAANFLKSCPRKMPNSDLPYGSVEKASLNIISNVVHFSTGYTDIFTELVCESYYSGLTFFPTEKTFRPMIQLTPFITFGPQGHLSNLQRCGFKTFNNYWDESYDNMSGKDRIITIRQVLSTLFALSSKQLQDMYKDMLPILEHNKNRITEMSVGELKLG